MARFGYPRSRHSAAGPVDACACAVCCLACRLRGGKLALAAGTARRLRAPVLTSSLVDPVWCPGFQVKGKLATEYSSKAELQQVMGERPVEVLFANMPRDASGMGAGSVAELPPDATAEQRAGEAEAEVEELKKMIDSLNEASPHVLLAPRATVGGNKDGPVHH